MLQSSVMKRLSLLFIFLSMLLWVAEVFLDWEEKESCSSNIDLAANHRSSYAANNVARIEMESKKG